MIEPETTSVVAIGQADAHDGSLAGEVPTDRLGRLAATVDRLDTATLLRGGILGLALLGLGGTSVELVFLRHWSSILQAIVWVGIVALTIAFALLVRRPSRSRIRAAQALAGGVLLVAGLGIALHVNENLDAGPLDREVGPRWEQMTVVEQWTAAMTGDVGPAPVLAPGALAEISLALVLATVRHPALRAGGRPEAGEP